MNAGDTQTIMLIDRCYYFALSKREQETIWFNSLATKDKVYAETLSMHLLRRLLDRL